jgi:hypothetical protein
MYSCLDTPCALVRYLLNYQMIALISLAKRVSALKITENENIFIRIYLHFFFLTDAVFLEELALISENN